MFLNSFVMYEVLNLQMKTCDIPYTLNLHCYRKIEEIMDKIDHAREGRIMNIKEYFTFIYTNNIIN
jgi:hypothetical protein